MVKFRSMGERSGPAAGFWLIEGPADHPRFRGTSGGRWIRVTSTGIARRSINTLGKTECPCEHCRG